MARGRSRPHDLLVLKAIQIDGLAAFPLVGRQLRGGELEAGIGSRPKCGQRATFLASALENEPGPLSLGRRNGSLGMDEHALAGVNILQTQGYRSASRQDPVGARGKVVSNRPEREWNGRSGIFILTKGRTGGKRQ